MRSTYSLVGILAYVGQTGVAEAHQATVTANSLTNGLGHPFVGPDHLAAMLAVGIWGTALGGRSVWLLPVTFLFAMAAGAVAGMHGLALPATEAGIVLSVLFLGGLIAVASKPPLWTASLLVGVFALFHGHAHGTEMSSAVRPEVYTCAFLVSTAMLHFSGVVLGSALKRTAGRTALRTSGALIALAGLVFFT